MEELLELRAFIEQKRYPEALHLLTELEEMSREDKINKIYSFAVILLLHLIKQTAEKRSTRSWELSIFNATQQISRVNKRRKAGGYYLPSDELNEVLTEAYPVALKAAALETFEGRHDDQELGKMLDQSAVEAQALALIMERQQA
jgi:hypothetical protein